MPSRVIAKGKGKGKGKRGFV